MIPLRRALVGALVPLSLALPWGLNVSDPRLHLPLPAKITVEIQEPIDVDEVLAEARPELVDAALV